MSNPRREQGLKLAALVLAVVSAIACIRATDDLELVLLMTTTVIAALATFDAAVDRRSAAFVPWLLVSLAMIVRIVPSIAARLSDALPATVERLDHLGMVGAGALLLGAMVFVLGPQSRSRRDLLAVGVIGGIGVMAAAAAATATQVVPNDFDSRAIGGGLEALGWGIGAALLAGTAIAAARKRRLSAPFAALCLGILFFTVLLILESAGTALDLGWWALAQAGLAAGALVQVVARIRTGGSVRNVTTGVVATIGSVFAIRAFVVALGADERITAGLVLLPLLAATLFALAATAFLDFRGRRDQEPESLPQELLEVLADSPIHVEDPAPTVPAPTRVEAPAVAAAAATLTAPAAVDRRVASPVQPTPTTPPPDPVVQPAAEPALSPSTTSVFSSLVGGSASAPAPTTPVSPAASPVVPVADPVPVDPAVVPVADHAPADPPVVPVADQPQTSPPAAAATGPAGRRSPVADLPSPLPAHLVDPSTGVLSHAGLQQQIIATFGHARGASDVSILMVAIPRLTELEAEHGRVVSAVFVAELARRLQRWLPEAVVARFATNAFAALIDQPDPQGALIERCADVLVDLLEPVTHGELSIEIDVAASIAQCYAAENAASFVSRANVGLERAVLADEPSLVVMP